MCLTMPWPSPLSYSSIMAMPLATTSFFWAWVSLSSGLAGGVSCGASGTPSARR